MEFIDYKGADRAQTNVRDGFGVSKEDDASLNQIKDIFSAITWQGEQDLLCPSHFIESGLYYWLDGYLEPCTKA